MNRFPRLVTAIGGLMLGQLLACNAYGAGQVQPSQSLLPDASIPNTSGVVEQPVAAVSDLSGDSRDDGRYAEGTRAIQENRWADAETIFTEVAAHNGAHADGALYWKAYAENKQGKSDPALNACAQLRQNYPKSRYSNDCSALEIEIRGKNGQPVEPESEKDANLKLLALSALMHRNESKGLPQAREILAGSDPETIKAQVLFVLAQRGSRNALKLLAEVANPGADSPAGIRTDTELQQRAQRMLSEMHGRGNGTAPGTVVHRVALDVAVTDANGKPVSGLTPQDFKVLDNGNETTLQSFRQYGSHIADAGAAGNTSVIILFDTVNTSLTDTAYARDQVEKFLRQDGGKLTYPVELLTFNGNGAESIAPASLDGNALANALDKSGTNLHPIRRAAAFWGAVERLQLSLGTLSQLSEREATQPGRKLLFWITPGWPLLIGTQSYPTERELQSFFDAIVAMSNGLRQARIELYSIDPVRTPGADFFEWEYYKSYLKGVPDARHAEAANLALQVLATQSGGMVMNYTNKDMWQEIASSIANADDPYFLAFNAPLAKRPDEYHALKITVDKPGLTVHTRSGYYNEP